MTANKTNFITVSVADHNRANQEALKLLLTTIQKQTPEILDNFYFLHPTGEIDPSFIRQITAMGVITISYPLERRNDPYRTKFLLVSLLKDWQGPQEYCLYLDPDHIALGPLSLKFPVNELFVSSEVNKLERIQAPTQLVKELQNTHYNTSLIVGRIEIWKKVLTRWESAYMGLDGIIPASTLEEVSFNLAAKQANIDIRPVDSAVQSNFSCFNPSCSFFHYGGQNPVGVLTKEALKRGEGIQTNVAKIGHSLHARQETWFLDAMLTALS